MITASAAIVLLGVLIFVHEMGHFIIAKISGVGVVKFSLGFGPKILSKKIGETEYLLSAIPLGGYVKMVGEEPDEEVLEGDLQKSFTNKPVMKRAGIVLAGPLFNIFFAIFVFSIIHMSGVPILTTEVGDAVEGSPAFEAGIQKGDLIISINGKEISKWEELTEIIKKSEGAELLMNIKRDDRYYEVQLRPKPFVDKNIFGEDVETYKIGVNASDKFITKRYNPFSAVLKGFQQTWWWTKLTGIAIVKLIDRTVPAKTLGGPILIVQMAGQQAQAGLMNFLFFMAVISINLGIINLFPIPILDGGHLFFFILEAIMGRPISIKKMEIAQQIGLVIIILLIVFVFYNDITRIFTK
ncbi:MAG: RIP metalloprotease RseP [Thermodesulfobacteriota bacterium]|nr:RIP metalloprotease RseP [Thermodesulfobacteriota bacterium]